MVSIICKVAECTMSHCRMNEDHCWKMTIKNKGVVTDWSSCFVKISSEWKRTWSCLHFLINTTGWRHLYYSDAVLIKFESPLELFFHRYTWEMLKGNIKNSSRKRLKIFWMKVMISTVAQKQGTRLFIYQGRWLLLFVVEHLMQ